MAELLTIGETMVSFAPDAIGPLRYVQAYGTRTAGAESNVALGVRKLGHSAAWISKLGDDEMGKYILNNVRSEGVDCSGVRIDAQHRTGIMLKQRSGSETAVFYYRENSAASHLCPADLKEEMFANAKILHLTGITPVLSASCADTISAAVALAKKHGVKISFDPNIRKKLWKEVDYTELMRSLTLAADIVLIGLDEAEALFGTTNADDTIAAILAKNPAAQIAVKDGAKGAIVASANEKHFIPPYACHCIEPIGAGDAYSAGFLAGVLEGASLETCGKMGGIAGALATETPGDVEGQPDAARMQAVLSKSAIVYR